MSVHRKIYLLLEEELKDVIDIRQVGQTGGRMALVFHVLASTSSPGIKLLGAGYAEKGRLLGSGLCRRNGNETEDSKEKGKRPVVEVRSDC